MRLRRIRRAEWDLLAPCSDRGDCRLLDFLEGLEGRLGKQRVRLLALFERVAQSGPPRRAEQSHQIDGEIWEFISGDLRVLWFYAKGRVVICSHGFVKKSQKTPRAEIDAARRELDRYLAAARAGRIEIIEEDA